MHSQNYNIAMQFKMLFYYFNLLQYLCRILNYEEFLITNVYYT
jgi:hypothetical protein